MNNANMNNANMNWANNEVVQTVPTSSMRNGEYPVCEGDMDDSCINAWEAGQRGPGVNRPLQYWPGESVTEARSGG